MLGILLDRIQVRQFQYQGLIPMTQGIKTKIMIKESPLQGCVVENSLIVAVTKHMSN